MKRQRVISDKRLSNSNFQTNLHHARKTMKNVIA